MCVCALVESIYCRFWIKKMKDYDIVIIITRRGMENLQPSVFCTVSLREKNVFYFTIILICIWCVCVCVRLFGCLSVPTRAYVKLRISSPGFAWIDNRVLYETMLISRRMRKLYIIVYVSCHRPYHRYIYSNEWISFKHEKAETHKRTNPST